MPDKVKYAFMRGMEVPPWQTPQYFLFQASASNSAFQSAQFHLMDHSYAEAQPLPTDPRKFIASICPTELLDAML